MKEGYGTIKELFESNLSIIGYDNDSYSAVCRKTDNLVNAYKLLTLRIFEDITSLKSAFETAVEEIGITQVVTPGSGGSAGGSGGGNSGGGSAGGGAVNSNTKPPKTSPKPAEKPGEKEPADDDKESEDTETTPIEPEKEAVQNRFDDLDGYAWATESIEALYEKGVISGKTDGKYAPGDSVTREEFIQMITKAFNLTGDGEVVFDDVKSDKWYYGAISAAIKSGIIKGISQNEFGIGKNIIRQDMAVIAANVLKAVGILDEEKQGQEFDDEDAISDYARTSVSTLAAMGILNGSNGKFEPTRNMTRAEAAIVVAALMNLQGLND